MAFNTSPRITQINTTSVSVSPWQTALTQGVAAAKRNRGPAIFMWGFGVMLIVSYYHVLPVHRALETVGEIKTNWGWVFSLISTAVFGGLIPAVLPAMLKQDGARVNAELVISSTLFWAYKGVETDYFYRFQGWLFGENGDMVTIAAKTGFDQFVWVPLFGLLNIVLFFVWRANGYNFRRSAQQIDRHWYGRRVLPAMIANWFIWIPAVAMIYSLPSALQIPVQNLILCFWVLILAFLTEPVESKSTVSSTTTESNS